MMYTAMSVLGIVVLVLVDIPAAAVSIALSFKLFDRITGYDQ